MEVGDPQITQITWSRRKGTGKQMSDVRGRMSEIRREKAERQRSEVGGRRTEGEKIRRGERMGRELDVERAY